MDTRINVLIPKKLLDKTMELVDDGYFSNLSEVIRDGLRKQVIQYNLDISSDEIRLLSLLKQAKTKGLLLDEEEMKQHGLDL